MRTTVSAFACLFVSVLLATLAGPTLAQQVQVDMKGVDATLFPLVVLEAGVTVDGLPLLDLQPSQFEVAEDNQVVPFTLTLPQQGGGVRAADVVFLIDNSGSMSAEIAAVIANVQQFAQQLEALGVDFRLGAVKFGQSSSPNPYVFNNGNLTDNVTMFRAWVQSMSANGGTEPGLQAILMACQQFNFRPGSQRHFIIITDEDSDGATTVTQACNCCNSKSIRVHAAVDCGFGDSYAHYCGPSSIRGCTGGLLFNVAATLGPVLDQIASDIAGSYIFTYQSPDPELNGRAREARLQVTHNGQTVMAVTHYTPGAGPRIVLTTATLALEQQSWAEGTTLTISAEITDAVPPGMSHGTLFTRRVGATSWNQSSLTHGTGDIWSATIPVGDVLQPGVQYYIWATDGSLTSTEPPTDPSLSPRNVAILPNVAPVITHQPVTTAIAGLPILVTADVSDQTNQVSSVRLRYRKGLTILYETSPMARVGSLFFGTIPYRFATEQGAEYFVEAFDDLGIRSEHGSWWFPHAIVIPRDGDGDAIPDYWETTGDLDDDGEVELPLHEAPYNADPRHKDVFVELDWMGSSGWFFGHDHHPNQDQINTIIQSLAQAPVDNPDGTQGVTLHVDTGQLGGGEEIPHQRLIDIGTGEDNDPTIWHGVIELKEAHFAQERRDVFRYCVFAHRFSENEQEQSNSGVSLGADLLVTLGTPPGGGPDGNLPGTFMHELGHTLGLPDEGPDPPGGNYRPNWLSVMNYAFQFSGLLTWHEGNNFEEGNFDYSRDLLPALNEDNGLDETVGLNGGSSYSGFGTEYRCGGDKHRARATGPIDWNCSGSDQETGVRADINGTGTVSILNSQDDWASLDFSVFSYFGQGQTGPPGKSLPRLFIDPPVDTMQVPFPPGLHAVPEIGRVALRVYTAAWPVGPDSVIVERRYAGDEFASWRSARDSLFHDASLSLSGIYEYRGRRVSQYGIESEWSNPDSVETLDFLGYQAPIVSDGSAVFPRGAQIPVQFLLRHLGGPFVFDAVADLYVQRVIAGVPQGEPIPAPVSGGGAARFTYGDVTNAYQVLLDSGGLTPGVWELQCWIDDGTRRRVRIAIE